jgi:hypothetical protein
LRPRRPSGWTNGHSGRREHHGGPTDTGAARRLRSGPCRSGLDRHHRQQGGDLERIETGDGGDVTAHARVAVDWDEETLEQLLTSTEADEIALWFDEPELVPAFDEVEGHGFRQKAAVLAIAVTAAGAAAGPSLASVAAPTAGGGGGSVYAPAASGGAGSVQAPSASGGAGSLATPGGSGGAGSLATPGGSGGAGSLATPGGSGGAGEATPAATSTGGGTPDTELAAIAGAGAVLISAAGFGLARKRTRPEQPA